MLDPTPRPLDHLTLCGAANDIALVVGDRSLTYAELEDQVGGTAAALRDLGLEPGDRVASWMPKTVLACTLPLAVARAGFVHVPINPVLRRAQAAHILADSGARLLIGNAARLDTLPAADRSNARAVAAEDWQAASDPLPPSVAKPDTLAALLYTSGSTGRPKGVMLSHANLWLGAASVAHYLGLSPTDRTLAVLPLAFDYGQSQLLAAWAAGGTLVALDYLLPRDVQKAVARNDISVLAGVPPLWLQLTELDWSGGEGASLRTLTNSGGHLPEPIVRRLRAAFPQARLHLMYGLTEAFRSTSLDPALTETYPDAVGVAVPFAEVAVVRPDGTQADVGEDGELVHAGPLVAHGYWRDPERTTARFRPAPAWMRSGGTAVWSGDRVVMGRDGFLRIRGRDDAMIKVSGNRVSPTEVEDAALASGAVRDCAAIGVKDARLGQAIVLVAIAHGQGAEERVRAYFAAEMPPHLRPSRVVWVKALPLGSTGKLDRTALAALAT